MERSETADPWIEPRPWTGAALASWNARARAALIDALITTAPLVTGLLWLEVGAQAPGVVLAALGLAATLLYAPLTLSRRGARNGQTIGKQVAGIRVVRDGGESVSTGFGLLRESLVKGLLFLWIGGLFLLIPWLLDLLWPLWDEQRRAVHDTIVSTHVVEA